MPGEDGDVFEFVWDDVLIGGILGWHAGLVHFFPLVRRYHRRDQRTTALHRGQRFVRDREQRWK
jgi:hypothetical protein